MIEDNLKIGFGMEYDTFIGKEVFSNNNDFIPNVTLNLGSGGSCSYFSMEQACGDLIGEIESGKKVLLYISPGSVQPKVKSSKNLLERLVKVLNNKSQENIKSEIIENDINDCYMLSGRNYKSFNKDEMSKLKELFYKDKRSKNLVNPFNYQPNFN